MPAIDPCVVLVPALGHIEPHCERSLCQLEARGYAVRRLFGLSQVDMARNRHGAPPPSRVVRAFGVDRLRHRLPARLG
jgi:hypothetical protein